MKIKELFQEAISFSQYKDQARQAIKNSIESCFNDLVLDNFEYPGFDLIKSGNPDQVSQHLRPVVSKYIRDTLRYHIELNLSVLARKIIGDTSRYSYRTPRPSVKISDIPSLGSANPRGNLVLLSETVYKKICDKVIDKFLDTIFSSWSGEPIFSFMTSFIQRYVDEFYPERLINDYASTFIHEIVHVKQHVAQQAQGKTQTQYRSYLQKTPKEFDQSFERNPQGELLDPASFYRLHGTSPQEIGSYVHEIAIKIIDSLYMEDAELDELKKYFVAPGGTSSNVDEYRTSNRYLHDRITRDVQEHLSLLPNTPKEKMIYRRYIKGVYLEIQRYIQYLINQKSKAQAAQS